MLENHRRLEPNVREISIPFVAYLDTPKRLVLPREERFSDFKESLNFIRIERSENDLLKLWSIERLISFARNSNFTRDRRNRNELLIQVALYLYERSYLHSGSVSNFLNDFFPTANDL